MKVLTSRHGSRAAAIDEHGCIVSSDIPPGEIHLASVKKCAGSRFVRFGVVNKNGTRPFTRIIPREGMGLTPMRVGDLFLSCGFVDATTHEGVIQFTHTRYSHHTCGLFHIDTSSSVAAVVGRKIA